MPVLLETSSYLTVQHILSAAATFNGVVLGRPTTTLGMGDAALTFSAKHLGADFNGAIVNLIDPMMATSSEVVRYDPGSQILNVYLRTSAGSVSSTAAQVAAAVQAAMIPPCPITACYGGDGTGTVVPASNVLADGADPEVVRNTRYSFASVSGGGGFDFGNRTRSVKVHQFLAQLHAATAWTLSVVNMDEGLMEIAAETVQIAGSSGDTVVLLDLNLILGPLQALKFVSNTYGVASALVRDAQGP